MIGTPFAPPPEAGPHRGRGRQSGARRRQGRRLARPLRRRVLRRRAPSTTTPRPGRSRCGPTCRTPGRSRSSRSTTRPAPSRKAWTGPQVAWKMARGLTGPSAARSTTLDLGLPRRRLLPRARQPAATAVGQPRPARPALVQRLAVLLQPGRGVHGHAARLPTAPTSSAAWPGSAGRAAGLLGVRCGPCGCSWPRLSSSRAFASS